MPTKVGIQQDVDSLESRFLDPGVRRGDELDQSFLKKNSACKANRQWPLPG